MISPIKLCFPFCAALFLAITSLPAAAVDKPPVDKQAVDRQPEGSRPLQAAEAQAPPKPTVNWNGLQLGAAAGAVAAANNFVQRGAYLCGHLETFALNCFETPASFGSHQAGVRAGPFLGWRWQKENYVTGIEADWSWKRTASSAAFDFAAECYGGPGAFCRTDAKSASIAQDWDSSFRARYGYLATPSILLYATGGLAVSQISGAFNFNATVTSGPSAGGSAISSASWSDVRAGGTAGAGVETEIWKGWKARIEYRYTDFGTYTKNVPVFVQCATCVSVSRLATINLRESYHALGVALGFDF